MNKHWEPMLPQSKAAWIRTGGADGPLNPETIMLMEGEAVKQSIKAGDGVAGVAKHFDDLIARHGNFLTFHKTALASQPELEVRVLFENIGKGVADLTAIDSLNDLRMASLSSMIADRVEITTQQLGGLEAENFQPAPHLLRADREAAKLQDKLARDLAAYERISDRASVVGNKQMDDLIKNDKHCVHASTLTEARLHGERIGARL